LVISAFCCPLSYSAGTISRPLSPDDSLKIIEKLYLQTDRVSYYPGEDIWFKAYLIDAADRLLSGHSKNMHVELISPASEIIDSLIVRLNEGLGNGDFRLPDKLNSGPYLLRAYTNYMRNFGDQFFYKKYITIINPADVAKSFSDSADNKKNTFGINFFPEGGSLVDNVMSVIAFKAVDDNGSAGEVSGEIYSSTGEKVTEFKSSHKGMGTFKLSPVSGLKYYAVSKNQDGKPDRYEIPVSFSQGVVLSVSGNQDGMLSLMIKTNSETLPLVLDHDLILNVSVRNLAFKTYSFRMKSLNSYFNIPTDDLPDGIIMLTLSGLNEMPFCERLVYIKNLEDVRLNLETDKALYNRRDSVSLKISLTGSTHMPQNAFLSLSAVDNFFADNFSGFPTTISSWFLLESDVHGPVEEPSYYFDPSNQDRLKDLDLLLITQGWRDFKWKYENNKYLPEQGFTISGKIRKKFFDTPVKNSVVNLGIFNGSKPYIFIIPVDSSGKFSLGGIDLTGPVKVVATITDIKDNQKGWLIIDTLRYVPEPVKSSTIPQGISYKNKEQIIRLSDKNSIIKENLKSFIQHSESKLSLQRKYKLSDTIMPGEVIITAKRQDALESPRERSRRYLMGTPDREVEITPILESYPNTFMLIKNRYISPSHIHGIPGLVNGEDLDPGMHNPMFLIDGAVSSREDVEALPLKWVKRIDIMDNPNSWSVWANRMRMSEKNTDNGQSTGPSDSSNDGPLDGVVSIILKDDSEIEQVKPSYSLNMSFSGFNEPRIFYSPTHHTTLESDYKPDLRTTLFWDPDIRVENNKNVFLNYFNADTPAKVKVIVEGITSTGIPVTGKAEYEVK
jgi:hypothetical protein